MNYLEKQARKLVENYLSDETVGDSDEIIRAVHDDINYIDNKKDIVSYLTIVLEANDLKYNEHLKACTNVEDCSINDAHESINYFLQQDLERNGVITNSDSFSKQEKSSLIQSLNKLAKDLKDIKDGQEIIFEEIEELKKWFIIGKKNWRQLAVMKVGEMVAGGIIAESTAKPFLDMINSELPKLLG